MDLVELPNGVRLRRDMSSVDRIGSGAAASHLPPLPRLRHKPHAGVESRSTMDATTLMKFNTVSEPSDGADKEEKDKEYSCTTKYLHHQNAINFVLPEAVCVPPNTQSQMEDAAPRNMEFSAPSKQFLTYANSMVGFIIMLLAAYKWSTYLAQLHENELWFSNIKEVEREISFRTECGLYYSYYKQLVQAPSLAQGYSELTSDNITEHPSTINVFHRFNIHGELFLATVYRTFGVTSPPIVFYANFTFALQGLLMSSLFLIAWCLSGTWCAGILAAAYITCNRLDVTRAEFTVGLREHWSIPFIFTQFALVGRYLGCKNDQNERHYLLGIYLCTLTFTITWQFAQFVLILQAAALFALASLHLVNKHKVCKILVHILLAMITVWYLQYYQVMIINSLVTSFIPVALLVLQYESNTVQPGIGRNLKQSVKKVCLVAFTSVLLNLMLKLILGQDADNHIFRFVKSKFGFQDVTDFETRLYLCMAAFQPPGVEFYLPMSRNASLPLYAFAIVIELSCMAITVIKRWSQKEKQEDAEPNNGLRLSNNSPKSWIQWLERHDELRFTTQMSQNPELCYHVAQSLLLAGLTLTTRRMKCFWSPYICIFASVFVAHSDIWNFVTSKLGGKGNRLMVNFIRHIVLFFIILILYTSYKEQISHELSILREFYDPDTVELMEWIKSNIPMDAAFSGSMQLMAAVKLCTGRRITNHPHFEDKDLRQKTKELYHIYSKTGPEEVHDILLKHNSTYIIVEDSICLNNQTRCGLPSIMDLTIGHIPDDGVQNPPHLVPSHYPRFCDQIRFDGDEYLKLFQKVFENRTFRIYQVLSKYAQ